MIDDGRKNGSFWIMTIHISTKVLFLHTLKRIFFIFQSSISIYGNWSMLEKRYCHNIFFFINHFFVGNIDYHIWKDSKLLFVISLFWRIEKKDLLLKCECGNNFSPWSLSHSVIIVLRVMDVFGKHSLLSLKKYVQICACR